MAGQVYANPDDIEQFARELKEFNSQLRDRMARLNGKFNSLGETWRDQEHQKHHVQMAWRKALLMRSHVLSCRHEQNSIGCCCAAKNWSAACATGNKCGFCATAR